MSKHEEANLILKLYELRREPVMREARDWFNRHFFPSSMSDYNEAIFGKHSGHLRMVLSYWDMAAALVNHGGISAELFNDTNGEHIGAFSRIQPILEEIRAAYGPHVYANLEKLVDATPNGRERARQMRERMKAMMAQVGELSKSAVPGGQS